MKTTALALPHTGTPSQFHTAWSDSLLIAAGPNTKILDTFQDGSDFDDSLFQIVSNFRKFKV